MSYVNFAIVCLGRTGSSHLVSLLNSHPDVHCAWEETFIHPDNTDVGAALDRYVFCADKPVRGVKSPWEAFERFPQLVDLMRDRDFRIIRLTRRNLFDQFISMRLAQINDRWLSVGGGYEVQTFDAPPALVRMHLTHFTAANRQLRELTDGFPAVDVTYEEIDTDLSAVFDLLGVEPAQVRSQMTKQRSRRQSEIVTNFAELRSAFAGSEFAHHFTG